MKPMSVKKFIKKKNKLIKKVTGVTLVPKKQIKKIDVVPLSVYWGDSYLCPYCVKYNDHICTGCPMEKAGNACSKYDSTYNQVKSKISYPLKDVKG